MLYWPVTAFQTLRINEFKGSGIAICNNSRLSISLNAVDYLGPSSDVSYWRTDHQRCISVEVLSAFRLLRIKDSEAF